MPDQFRMIPVRKIFIDARDETIETIAEGEGNERGSRTPHGAEGPGYQRDPWTRLPWLTKRAANFNPMLCKPVDVSKRDDGTYAAIDGGGRWLMAQLADPPVPQLMCRVHEGLSRQEEAELFNQMDSEVYKLRAIDSFIALLGAEHPMALAIANSVRPYRIGINGQGVLKCVAALTTLYTAFEPNYQEGGRLIKRACKIAASGWSGFNGQEFIAPTKTPLDGKCLTALAMLIDAKPEFDERVMLRVLERNPPKQLEQAVIRNNSLEGKLPATTITVLIAKKLASAYNRSFAGSPSRKIKLSDVDNSSVWEAVQEHRTFSALKTAYSERTAA